MWAYGRPIGVYATLAILEKINLVGVTKNILSLIKLKLKKRRLWSEGAGHRAYERPTDVFATQARI